MTIQDHALDYLQRGWAPIPVHGSTKKPIGEGWQKLRIKHDDNENTRDWKRTCYSMIFKEPRLLAMLKMAQNCWGVCDYDEKPHDQSGGFMKAIHSGHCAGIHRDEEQHRCLEHWEAVK